MKKSQSFPIQLSSGKRNLISSGSISELIKSHIIRIDGEIIRSVFYLMLENTIKQVIDISGGSKTADLNNVELVKSFWEKTVF